MMKRLEGNTQHNTPGIGSPLVTGCVDLLSLILAEHGQVEAGRRALRPAAGPARGREV